MGTSSASKMTAYCPVEPSLVMQCIYFPEITLFKKSRCHGILTKRFNHANDIRFTMINPNFVDAFR